MCEALIGLFGAIVGGFAAIVGSWVAVKAQHKAERRKFLFEKQYETLAEVLEFLNTFLDLMGEKIYHIENTEITFEEQGVRLYELERKFRSHLPVVFDDDDIERIDGLCDDISQGVTASKRDGEIRFKTTPEQLKEFIKTVKEKYFKVEKK